MKEGKVIKIIRQQQRELVGVVQSVKGELACSSTVVSFPLIYVCVFLHWLVEAFSSQRWQSVACHYSVEALI